jgi:hypothetical protein
MYSLRVDQHGTIHIDSIHAGMNYANRLRLAHQGRRGESLALYRQLYGTCMRHWDQPDSTTEEIRRILFSDFGVSFEMN